MEIQRIGIIRTKFPEKFGIPRQSGLTDTTAEIVFEPKYRNPDALRGIEEYDYLWIIWGFSENRDHEWRPMVRPPRLGGNTRMGVFATRSPYRPNPLGLSCVRLVEVKETSENGFVLVVEGADMMDGTPIYDIKPYLPYVEAKAGAAGGFPERTKNYCLNVVFKELCDSELDHGTRDILCQLLSQDPRPSYQEDPDRIYGMKYDRYEVKFRVEEKNLYVLEITQERS